MSQARVKPWEFPAVPRLSMRMTSTHTPTEIFNHSEDISISDYPSVKWLK